VDATLRGVLSVNRTLCVGVGHMAVCDSCEKRGHRIGINGLTTRES
jgi:hypothetical protein